MIKELWRNFPQLLEEKINGLLDEAEPRPQKAFQLYKACQRENLWGGTFEKFSENLSHYFSRPRLERHKSSVDKFLDRPLQPDLYDQFQLDFRSGQVNSLSVLEIASWAHHLIRVSTKSTSLIISTDVLTRALHYITNPPLFEKARDILFEDFCAAWRKASFSFFGKKYDSDLDKILSELRWLERQNNEERENPGKPRFFPTIYLTQTEIDWTEAVLKAARDNTPIPSFPLSRGPEKQRLIDLVRTISLYRIVQTTRLPELIEQKENIRVTILERCQRLLQERAR